MSQQLELLTENPSQWSAASRVTPEIQKKEIKPFLVLALKELEGNTDSRISSLVHRDKFATVRAVLRHVARSRSAIKELWNEDDMRSFLEGLRFSPDCVAELTTLLCTAQLYDNIPTHLCVKPGITNLQWKIDISLCQSHITAETDEKTKREILHRLTFVIIVLELNNGEKHTYRLTLTKFHELRYTVASALKSMIVLEKRKWQGKTDIDFNGVSFFMFYTWGATTNRWSYFRPTK